MRASWTIAFASMVVWVMTSVVALAQTAPAADESSPLWPWGVGVPTVGGLAWWAWTKRDQILAYVKKLTASAPGAVRADARHKTEPKREKTGRPAAEGDSDDEIATKVITPERFGSITCVSGTLIGQKWDIPAGGLTLGRDTESDIVIDDSRVSGRHAQIRPKGNDVFVVDYASTNGVFINNTDNRIVGEARLASSDVVWLSPTPAAQFIFRR
jgi:FHA domain